MDGEIVEQTAAELAAEQSDMNAGYSDQEPTATPEPVAKPEPVVAEVQAVAEAPKPVQLTADEYQNLMRSATEITEIKAAQQKMIDTAFGRIGRAIEDMKATGAQVPVTVEDFPELSAEFPELAEMQVKGLNKVLAKARGMQAIDPATIEQMVSTRTADLRKELIDSHLDGVMTDWADEVKKPEFAAWMSKQDAATQALSSSDKMTDAAKMLRLYSARPKPVVSQKTTTPPVATISPRQKRLEAAVNPRGTGGNAGTGGNTELDDMNAGYNS